MQYGDMPGELNDLSKEIVDSLFCVHKELGPGFLEKIYEDALCCELSDRKLIFEKQKTYVVGYKNHLLPTEYRLDFVIDDKIVLELKAVERILPLHQAQLMSYMKLAGCSLGFLVNFNETLIKDGIRRHVLTSNLRSFASSR